MPDVTSVHPIKTAYQYTTKAAQKAVEGVSVAVTSTESFKKIWQVVKGIIELVGVFTAVTAFKPVLQAVKVISVTVGGFDIVGRLKEWVVPDKSGETLIHKHWTKIISRVHLAFANFLDFLNMIAFFKLYTVVKLDVLAAMMTKIYFFKVIFDNFPGLEVIKHPFIAFASSWSILDSAVSIHRKRMGLNHMRHKERNWTNLANRSYERQRKFFEARQEKYEARVDQINLELSTVKKTRQKKSLEIRLKNTTKKVESYSKMVAAIKADVNEDHADKVQKFVEKNAKRWQQKIKNIRIDFIKSSISITCEIFKIFVVSTALILSVTLVGWAFLPPLLIVFGLLSNGSSLTKFVVDKLVNGKDVKHVKVPKLTA